MKDAFILKFSEICLSVNFGVNSGILSFFAPKSDRHVQSARKLCHSGSLLNGKITEIE